MKILRINQATELLQISRPQLYKLMGREYNPIPYTKVGQNSTRFIEEEIKDWLEHTCPYCEHEMENELENNGFTEPDGPSNWQATGKLKCSNCGAIK